MARRVGRQLVLVRDRRGRRRGRAVAARGRSPSQNRAQPADGRRERPAVDHLRAEVHVQALEPEARLVAHAARRASAACAGVNPNLESSPPVWIAATRTGLDAGRDAQRRPPGAARAGRRPRRRSRPPPARPASPGAAPAATAASMSPSVLALPCSTIRAGLPSAASAAASSPSEETSKPSPSSTSMRSTPERAVGLQGEATRRRPAGARAARRTPPPGPQRRGVVHVERRAVLGRELVDPTAADAPARRRCTVALSGQGDPSRLIPPRPRTRARRPCGDRAPRAARRRARATCPPGSERAATAASGVGSAKRSPAATRPAT